ncbi:MAG: diguanylate cyclase [Methylococcaceae bacterium]|nr:diguanylate cyclase [Methylococcaceae bacterium]
MSSSDSEITKWKDKYYNALDELELLERSNKDTSALFCRALIRLSLAAKGFNQQLDPYLLRVRNQLKQGISNLELANELTKFSEALLRFEDGTAEEPLQDAGLLFDFLIAQETNQGKVGALNLFRNQYDTGKIADAKSLLQLLTKFCAPETLEIDHCTSDLNAFSANLDINFIAEQLIQLIQDMDMPDTLQADAKKITQALKKSQTEESFREHVDAALALLQSIKKHGQFEKKEMEIFLAHVTQQLTSLGGSVSSASVSTKEIFVKRNNLDLSVVTKMEELQVSSASATKLEPLKQLIKSELDNISAQIQTYKQEEKNQQVKTEQLVAVMAAEIEAVKAEAQSLKESLKQVSVQALTDVLTKLPNRAAYDQRFKAECARWHRNKEPLSLLVWDIDFFKKINDNYGHKTGDKTLIIIAKLLSQYCRETDFVSRFGGEEFTMLLSNTNSDAALVLAEKIRRIIEKTGFNYAGQAISITISCGIAELRDNDTQETLFVRADTALYDAKKKGRNQCVIAA